MSDGDMQIMATDAMKLAKANRKKTKEIVDRASIPTGTFRYDFYAEQAVERLLKCQYETMNCLEEIAGMLHLPKDMNIVRLDETSQHVLGIARPALRRGGKPNLRAVLDDMGVEDIGPVRRAFDSDDDDSGAVALGRRKSDDDDSGAVAAGRRKPVAVPTVLESDDDEFGS